MKMRPPPAPTLALLLLAVLPWPSPAEADLGCEFLEDKGWGCKDGTCLPLDWTCDGEVQCSLPDRSDEEQGCQLYPETGE